MFWKPTLAIQGDVGHFMVELANQLGESYSCSSDWLDKLKQGTLILNCVLQPVVLTAALRC